MEKEVRMFGNNCLNTCVSFASPRLNLLDKTRNHSIKDMIRHIGKNN